MPIPNLPGNVVGNTTIAAAWGNRVAQAFRKTIAGLVTQQGQIFYASSNNDVVALNRPSEDSALVNNAAGSVRWVAYGVVAAAIPDDTITEQMIKNGVVTSGKLGNAAVTAAKMASDAVTESKLLDGAVTENKIGLLAVDTNKLADDAVELTKMEHGTEGQVLGYGPNGVPRRQTPTNGLATLTDGAMISWDVRANPNAEVTLGGNRTIAAPTNPTAGYYILNVKQDATGSRTVTWNAAYSFQGIGGAPTLSTAANAVDKIGFAYENGKMRCIGIVRNV